MDRLYYASARTHTTSHPFRFHPIFGVVDNVHGPTLRSERILRRETIGQLEEGSGHSSATHPEEGSKTHYSQGHYESHIRKRYP